MTNEVNAMGQSAQILSVFVNLTNELKPFVKVEDLKIAFDTKGNAYLIGDDFLPEQLHANFLLHREIREEIRLLIAKHRSPYIPYGQSFEGVSIT